MSAPRPPLVSTPAAPGDRLSRRGVALVLAGLVAALGVRLLLIPANDGLRGDLDQYARWAHRLATDLPFGAAYQLDMSYMPVLVAVYELLARTVPAFVVNSDASDLVVRIALKVPPLLGDLAIAAGLIALLRPDWTRAWITATLVLLVPATWYLSAWWGQFDAIFVALALWTAILTVRNRAVAAGILLGLMLMTKPQALFLAVPFAAYAIGSWGVRRAAGFVLLAGLTSALTWLPFLPYGGIGDYLRDVSYYQNHDFPILSVRAWNPWWLVQEWAAGGSFLFDSEPIVGPITARIVGLVATAFSSALVFVALVRRPSRDRLFLGLAATSLGAFCLMTTMHERYAYAALVFLAPLLARPVVRTVWVVLAATITLNVAAAAAPTGVPGSVIPLAGPLGVAGSLAMIGATVVVFALLLVGEADVGEQGAAVEAGEAPAPFRAEPVDG